LGRGAGGDVLSCIHKETGEERAVKIVWHGGFDFRKEQIGKEIKILRSLDHPNIVKMYEFFKDKINYYIVTEICKGGDLTEEIHTRKEMYSEKEAAILMKQILQCVNFCHKNHLIHKDLKPDNIILEENKDSTQIKIIDFGLAKHFAKNEIFDDPFSDQRYRSPETYNKSKYNEKCDIWSCGIILCEILTGVNPFYDGGDSEESFCKMVEKIKLGSISFSDACWEIISDNAKNLIAKLLAFEPNDRPSAEEALKHPWITEISIQ